MLLKPGRLVYTASFSVHMSTFICPLVGRLYVGLPNGNKVVQHYNQVGMQPNRRLVECPVENKVRGRRCVAVDMGLTGGLSYNKIFALLLDIALVHSANMGQQTVC
jgi:hypothetical protein